MLKEERRIKDDLAKRSPEEVYEYLSDVWENDRPTYRKYHLDQVSIKYPRIGLEKGVPTLCLSKKNFRLDLHAKSQRILAAIDYNIQEHYLHNNVLPPPNVILPKNDIEFTELLGDEKPKFDKWIKDIKDDFISFCSSMGVPEEYLEVMEKRSGAPCANAFTISSEELANVPESRYKEIAKTSHILKDTLKNMDDYAAYSIISMFWTSNKGLYKALDLDEIDRGIPTPNLYISCKNTRDGYFRYVLTLNYHGIEGRVYGDYSPSLRRIEHWIYTKEVDIPMLEPPGEYPITSEEEFKELIGNQYYRFEEWANKVKKEKELCRKAMLEV